MNKLDWNACSDKSAASSNLFALDFLSPEPADASVFDGTLAGLGSAGLVWSPSTVVNSGAFSNNDT